MVDWELKVNAIDEATQTSLRHIDLNLEALDGCVNHCCRECETTEAELRLAEGRIELLEERLSSQRGLIEQLVARVEGMEGKLCHCGKGKGKEITEVVPSLLGSPLVLDHPLEEDNNSDNSYHTPPIASLSIPSQSSPADESDKENTSSFGTGYDLKIVLVPIGEAPPENTVAIPICEPTLNISGLECLIAVRGQRAVHTLGQPKSSFHLYLCSIGMWSSTHHQSNPCCSYQGSPQAMSSEGSNVGV